MLDHHLQRSIVYKLAFVPEARFSDLKPDDIENKLFTYHLKKVVSAGYAAKNTDGLYSLTAEGRRLGYQSANRESFLLNKAYSTLFLIVRRQADDAWLLYNRHVHPLLGYTTFPVATPRAELTAPEAATHDLQAKTSIIGTFQALGGGFCHVYRGSELESFTNFSLLVCEDARGDVIQQDPNGEYAWVQDPDFKAATMFPDMPRWVERYQTGEPFFTEEIVRL